MSLHPAKKSNLLERFVVLLAVTIVVGLLAIQSQHSSIFDLRFNTFAMLSLVGVCVNLVFIIIAFSRRKRIKSTEFMWYFLFLCTLVLFGTFEMLQRLSAAQSGALFWAQMGGIGPAFEAVGLFLFALFYTKAEERHNITVPLVLLAAAILLFFHANGALIFQTSESAIKSYPWGFNNEIGPAFIFNALWALALPVVGIRLFYKYRKQTQNTTLKQQSGLLAIAFAFPVVGALIFDILAPSFGASLPPLHLVFTAGTAGVMLYGLSHYRLFQVSPASVAQDILSAMSEAVVVTNHDLHIELLNQAASDIFAGSEHTQAASILDYFSDEQSASIKQALSHFTGTGKALTVGSFALHGHSGDKQVRITASQISESQGVGGFIFVIADITELQNSYNALEKEKQSVEQKVQERTKELREAQKRLAEMDKIKTEFVLLTSHNLRTPLTTLKGNLELLSESHLDDKQNDYLEKLTSSSKRLGDLVEELLTITSIEAGSQAVFENIKVQQILEPYLPEAKERPKKAGVELKVTQPSEPLYVFGNLALLQTVLRNIIENAFKFTKHGLVNVTVARDEHNIEIIVTDTGIGIEANEIPKLFTKFHRATSVMQYDYDGEGIGLYLSKLIIEEHGGQIELKSEINKGSSITIKLPAAKQDRQ